MAKLFNKAFVDALFLDANKSPRLRQNHDLRNSGTDTSQRMLNALMPETEVPIHQHENTSETVICLSGKLEEILYDLEIIVGDNGIIEEKFTERTRYLLCPEQGVYGMQIPMGVWHTVNVLEPSIIFEAKDGAYIFAK